METTLAIVKPDAVRAQNTGNILARLEAEGFFLRGLKLLRLRRDQAQAFYKVHEQRPFFADLVEFMTSGPVVAVALERDGAVAHLRQVMGATDSTQAEPGTIRALYGSDVQNNAIHGSDSSANATLELAFFFARSELLSGE